MNISFIKETYKKLFIYIKTVKFKYGYSALALWLNWGYCFLIYGATPSDWYDYEMYKYRGLALKSIITRRKNCQLDSLFNDRSYKNLFDDKAQFNKVFSCFIHRKWLDLSLASETEIDDFIVKNNGVVVVKPAGLSSGRGVWLFDSQINNIEDIRSLRGEHYLLEERIQVVDQLRALNPPSCQTLRIYTMITSESEVEVVGACLRVGGSDAICDNFHARGVTYHVDVSSGVVSYPGKDILLNEYIFHPSSGILMCGFTVPNWDSIIAFSKRAALMVPSARFIGWDIALTRNGCELIEGNYYVYCGLLQIFDKEGKYFDIKRYYGRS